MALRGLCFAAGVLACVSAGCFRPAGEDAGTTLGCRIGDHLYSSGELDPSNPCLACDPSLSTVSFAGTSSTAPCGDGGSTFCHQGRCLPGCTVAGVFYRPGEADPAQICRRCDPTVTTERLTLISGLARAGECPAGQLCVGGACAAGCYIAGSTVAAGALDPGNGCRGCQPDAGILDWSPLGSGACGDGGTCYLGSCELGCVIESASYPAGNLGPDGCSSCQPSLSFTAWSPLSGVAPLGGCDGGEICDVGTCRSGCWISNAYVPEGTAQSGNACTLCVPALSPTAWSPLTSATTGACDAGEICARGSCRGACLIDGGIFARFSYPLSDTARCCGPASSTTDWTPDFSAGPSYPGSIQGGGGLLGQLVVADIDGDGHADLASLQNNDREVTIYYGRGSEQMSPPVPVVFPWAGPPYGSSAFSIAFGDLNQDRLLDLVVLAWAYANGNGFQGIGVMLNLGDAGFAPMVQYPLPNLAISMSVTDLNGDQYSDVAIAGPSGLSILFNRGDGGLTLQPSYSPDGGLSSVIAGDYNGDGRTDLLAIDQSGTQWTVLYNDGAGNFPDASTIALPPLSYPQALVAIDMNSDGRTDLLVSDYYSNLPLGNGPSTTVLLAQVDGSFQAISYETPYLPSLVAADFDQDGYPDVIGSTSYGYTSQGDFYLFINRGDGTLLPFSAIDAGATEFWAVAGVFGDDSIPDLAVFEVDGGPGGLGLTIYRNGCR